MEPEDILWIEKYRPKKLDEMVMDDHLRKRFQDIIDNPTRMPHLLFIGVQGTGKTTLARILVSEIIKDRSDILVINGSDQRGIEVFRSLIPEFLSVPPITSPVKIVFIDEGDNMTQDAKKIFRAVLEKYHSYSRFIITANDDTFTGPIKSRFEIVKFTKLDKKYITDFCKKILDSENVKYNEESIEFIVNQFYPDTRKIVGCLQQCSINNVLDTRLIQLSGEDTVVQMLINIILYSLKGEVQASNFELISLSRFVTNNYVDFTVVYKTLFEKLNYKTIPLKVIISKYLNQTVNAISPSMVFYEFMYEFKKRADELRGILGTDILEEI